MANLQYIGARYVPIVFDNPDDHSAAWKSGVSYENLVIVTYLDDSYTSRKPVPASVGNPADNPDYWAKTGDFNAALTALQNRVNTVENAITEINGRPRYLLIGDSYAIGTNVGLSYGWIEQVKSILGLTEGVDVFSYGVGGAGFIGNGYTFLNALNSAINDLDDDQKESITNIFVAGGFNDIGDNGVVAAINTFCNTARANFPHAKITIAFNAAYENSKLLTPISGTNYRKTKLDYQRNESGAEIIPDLYSCLFSGDYIGADGIHPNQAGYELLGKQTACCLVGGSCPNDFESRGLTFTPETDLSNAAGQQFYMKRNIDSTTIWMSYFYITGTYPTSDSNNFIKLGSLGFNLPVTSQSALMTVPVSAHIVTNDNLRHVVNLEMRFDSDGSVYVRCPLYKAGGTRYNWNEVTLLLTLQSSVTLPMDSLVF